MNFFIWYIFSILSRLLWYILGGFGKNRFGRSDVNTTILRINIFYADLFLLFERELKLFAIWRWLTQTHIWWP